MYTATKRHKKRRGIAGFFLIVLVVLVCLSGIVWWFFVRSTGSQTTSINSTLTQNIAVEAEKKKHSTEFYSLELPMTWEAKGKHRPTSDSVYFEYQNTEKNFDNRGLRVYVDVFPADLPINHLLPITVVGSMLIPAVVSDDCADFSSPPSSKANAQKQDFIQAKWQGVTFTCDLKKLDRKTATASAEEGYGVSVANSKGVVHKFFFVFIDRNVQPDHQFLAEVIKSFKVP